MAKANGRSTRISTGPGAEVRPTPTAVAAAASVPSSFTSTKVFWSTRVR